MGGGGTDIRGDSMHIPMWLDYDPSNISNPSSPLSVSRNGPWCPMKLIPTFPPPFREAEEEAPPFLTGHSHAALSSALSASLRVPSHHPIT